jgi:hypothetical protein
MPHFLDLPREIRNLIYIAVLDPSIHWLTPPSSPKEAGKRKLEEPSSGFNQYPLRPLFRTRPALLFANRQVHAEFTDVIERQKRLGRISYKLDCLVFARECIYPTWLSVPTLCARIDRVNVDVRVLGEIERKTRSMRKGWAGWPHDTTWSVFELITRFLERGPDLLAPVLPLEQLQVEEMVINFFRPSPALVTGSPLDSIPQRDDPTHDEVQILACMECYMFGLLNQNGYTMPNGEIMYERVKVIKICLNGKEETVFDLRVLADMSYDALQKVSVREVRPNSHPR